MDRTTTGIFLAALLVSCSMNSVLRADELVMRDNFLWQMRPVTSG